MAITLHPPRHIPIHTLPPCAQPVMANALFKEYLQALPATVGLIMGLQPMELHDELLGDDLQQTAQLCPACQNVDDVRSLVGHVQERYYVERSPEETSRGRVKTLPQISAGTGNVQARQVTTPTRPVRAHGQSRVYERDEPERPSASTATVSPSKVVNSTS